MKIQVFLLVLTFVLGTYSICAPSENQSTDPNNPCVIQGAQTTPFLCNLQGFVCTGGETCANLTDIVIAPFSSFEDANWCSQEVPIGVGGQTTNIPCGSNSMAEQNSGCIVGGDDVRFYPQPHDSPLENNQEFTFTLIPEMEPACYDFNNDTCTNSANTAISFWKSCAFLIGTGLLPTQGPTMGNEPFIAPEGDPLAWALLLSGVDGTQNLKGGVTVEFPTPLDRTTEVSFFVMAHPETVWSDIVVELPDGNRYFRIQRSGAFGDWTAQSWEKVVISFTAQTQMTRLTIRDVSPPGSMYSAFIATPKVSSFGDCCDCENPASCIDFVGPNPVSNFIPNICTSDFCTSGLGCLHNPTNEAAICLLFFAPPPMGWPEAFENQNIAIDPPIVTQEPLGNDGYWLYECSCGSCEFTDFHPQANTATQSIVSILFLVVIALTSLVFM